MTREELVEELNKIEGLVVKQDGETLKIEIGCYFFKYINVFWDGLIENAFVISVADRQTVMFYNRTPEQVLSAVKALVG